MSIGDINSQARGSGARYNDGKVPLDLLPLRLLSDSLDGETGAYMASLADIQERRPGAIAWLARYASTWDLILAARVFEFGKKKYAAWNWTKGMPWSVPLACAARHLLALDRGEDLDEDSGLPHLGHFWCNVIMLYTFEKTYPEGDDLPPEGALAAAGKSAPTQAGLDILCLPAAKFDESPQMSDR